MRIIWILTFVMLQSTSFKTTQLQHQRVKSAYDEKETTVKKYFEEKNLSPEGYHIFLRAFKLDQALEVWIKPKNESSYTLLHTYDVCARSGVPGPKRREGDAQVPEGIYQINHFNPVSNFHLSLGIDYPNAADKILSDRKNPGSAIYIHGNCVTIGCIPLTDEKIKELYIMAVEAKNNGQQKIPVHIFPTRLNNANLQDLTATYGSSHAVFWKNLQTIYSDFESHKNLKAVRVNKKGEYYF
jgi:murein L,D-transpeptidase YafK